jgi:hypothetical protein
VHRGRAVVDDREHVHPDPSECGTIGAGEPAADKVELSAVPVQIVTTVFEVEDEVDGGEKDGGTVSERDSTRPRNLPDGGVIFPLSM